LPSPPEDASEEDGGSQTKKSPPIDQAHTDNPGNKGSEI
jgi:hypothetical protein